MTPTARSLKYLRDAGYTAEVVEKFNSFTKRKNDLFGFLDILAIREGEVLGVQTTSAAHVANRIKKIQEHENVSAVRKAGIGIHVHGWRKAANGRWQIRVEDVS